MLFTPLKSPRFSTGIAPRLEAYHLQPLLYVDPIMIFITSTDRTIHLGWTRPQALQDRPRRSGGWLCACHRSLPQCGIYWTPLGTDHTQPCLVYQKAKGEWLDWNHECVYTPPQRPKGQQSTYSIWVRVRWTPSWRPFQGTSWKIWTTFADPDRLVRRILAQMNCF